jgi:hypothetical protein
VGAEAVKKRPIDLINDRLYEASEYLRVYGWTKGTHGERDDGPTDIRGALLHADRRDGYEAVAYRLLAARGYDMAWNDLVCLNVFEAVQVLNRKFSNADVEAIYGRNWYGILGLFKLLRMAEPSTLQALAAHIGPADERAVHSALCRVGENPAFEDAHMILAELGLNQQAWMMTDALIANSLSWPDLDMHLARVIAPVALKLGLA